MTEVHSESLGDSFNISLGEQRPQIFAAVGAFRAVNDVKNFLVRFFDDFVEVLRFLLSQSRKKFFVLLMFLLCKVMIVFYINHAVFCFDCFKIFF